MQPSTIVNNPLIAIIGSSNCSKEEAFLAESVGREIARHAAILVCGGLGGVMEASCKGARSQGGITIGILPGDDPGAANAYVTIPIATGLGEGRNLVIVKSARSVIAIGGEYGTLSEIAFALKNRKKIIGLGTWELVHRGKKLEVIQIARDAVDAVARAMN